MMLSASSSNPLLLLVPFPTHNAVIGYLIITAIWSARSSLLPSPPLPLRCGNCHEQEKLWWWSRTAQRHLAMSTTDTIMSDASVEMTESIFVDLVDNLKGNKTVGSPAMVMLYFSPLCVLPSIGSFARSPSPSLLQFIGVGILW